MKCDGKEKSLGSVEKPQMIVENLKRDRDLNVQPAADPLTASAALYHWATQIQDRRRSTTTHCPTTVGLDIRLLWERTDFDLTVGQGLVYR